MAHTVKAKRHPMERTEDSVGKENLNREIQVKGSWGGRNKTE